MKKVSLETEKVIIHLLLEKNSVKKVARTLHLGDSTVFRYKNAHFPDLPRLPAGRKRLLSDYQMRKLKRRFLKGKYRSGVQAYRGLS